MIRQLLIALFACSLTACVTSPAKGDSPANDLHAMLAGAKADLAPRTLPNGKTYCIEDSATDDEHDRCAENLEDGFFLSEKDKSDALDHLARAVHRIELSQNPCGFWRSLFHRDECR